jgi:DNA repair protein RadC
MSAAGIIMAHNHPSGDPTPSPEDNELTRRLVKGSKLLGITILDHVIVGDKACYYSYADTGTLKD